MYTEKDHTNYPAGKPIVVKKGSELNIAVNNSTSVDTNIHWHGLSLPNDQDGPHFLIDKDGGEFDYSFTPDYSGSYWYHSHNRPVRDQVDFGMFVPMIILDETDEQYTVDRIVMIDDWAVSRNTGHMQVEGDVDTVTGLSGSDIEALNFTNGDLVKLRIIQASTAKNTTVNFPFDVLVTHTDGMALEKPYMTRELTLSPAERYDVIITNNEPKNAKYTITNERDSGFEFPLNYAYDKSLSTPEFTQHTAVKELTFDVANNAKPDIEVRMDSSMKMGEGHQ